MTKETDTMIEQLNPMAGVVTRLWRAALATAVAVLCALAYASAASAAPAWDVEQSMPAQAAPGSTFPSEILIANVGAGEGGGGATITITAPGGTQLVNYSTTIGVPYGLTCGSVPTTMLRCRLANRFGGAPTNVRVGESFDVRTTFEVEAGAPEQRERADVHISGGGAPTVDVPSPSVVIESARHGFGIAKADSGFLNADGSEASQAGGHPYAFATTIRFNTKMAENGEMVPAGSVKDVTVQLPPGLLGNPQATPQCTEAQLTRLQFENTSYASCPVGSQVGVATLELSGLARVAVYNMKPPVGKPAELAFNVSGKVIHLFPSVRPSDYGLEVEIKDADNTLNLYGTTLTLWGVPSDSSHDVMRLYCASADLNNVSHGSGCPISSPASAVPFLRNPTSCTAPEVGLFTSLAVDSWEGEDGATQWQSHDNNGAPLGPTGCELVPFEPAVSAQPTATAASSPSGLDVAITVPQPGLQNPAGLGSSDVKQVQMRLPAGMTVNPAAAQGLGACTVSEVALGSSTQPTCPENAKIGEATIETPLLSAPMKGWVYLAQPSDPFSGTMTIYLVAQGSGVTVKLPGQVTLDQTTGQVTATFAEDPQLPFEKLSLSLFSGPRATLATPAACGNYSIDSALTPWSGAATTNLTGFFPISSGCGGGFQPSLLAGTASNQAGSFSTFTTTVSRSDEDQALGRIAITTPPGLSAVLSGVPECSEADAVTASCPAASQIGHVEALAGVGPDPIQLPQPGRREDPVFLTGPYEGAPFGLAIVEHAEAGPFNLGDIVVRAAVQIDPRTAQVKVLSDPIPTIKGGVPLDIQKVKVVIDRKGFMFNPTSCEPMAVSGTVSSSVGASKEVSTRFQAANCAKLPFKPQMLAFTQARHSRRTGAYLHFVMKSGSGQVGLREVHVELPKALPSVLKTLQQACTEAQFAKDPAGCPEGSVVGRAVIHTPVLPVALKGRAYFVSHGGAKFPELVIVLHGYGVTIQLNGETFISKAGVTSSTFKTLPDVPFSRFDLILPRGTHPALTGNGDLCAKPLTMPTRIVAQSGKLIERDTTIHVKGCKPYLKVVGRHVGKRGASLIVKVAPAGRLTVSGEGIESIARTVRKAGTVKLKLHLGSRDKRVLASHRHRRLKLSVDVRFKPTHGGELHERVTVLMR